MPEIYLLALIISLATGLALIVSRFKQPLLVSYVVVGALLSAFRIIKPEQLEFLAILPEVGLAFLLFLVGMELDLHEFRRLGKNVLIATCGQVFLTTGTLTLILTRFGVGLNQALIISSVTAFSSTILVIKILLEERELSSLHGKLAVGSLLVEDLLAVIFLMVLAVTANTGGDITALTLVSVIAKGAGIIWLAFIAGKKVLPRIFCISGENPELLIVTAISWCLIFVSLTVFAGFSLPIGAFLAGVSLAQSAYRLQISARLKPLRDFFVMIFFIDLGTGLSLSGVMASAPLAFGLLFYGVIIKPLIFIVLLSRLGLKIHPSFQTGIYISSISEFSLIVLTQASRQGIVDKNFLSPVIFATVLSFVFSSLLITHRRRVFRLASPVLKYFEKKSRLEATIQGKNQELKNHAVLIGCHRSGLIILKHLQKLYGEKLVVLDFNPDVVEELRSEATNCLYGDVSDPDVLEQVNLKEAKVVVSTVRDLGDNIILLDYLEKIQSRAAVIITAEDVTGAIKLYERGAHYVSLPMNLEGNTINRIISEHNDNFLLLSRDKERRLGDLKKIKYA